MVGLPSLVTRDTFYTMCRMPSRVRSVTSVFCITGTHLENTLQLGNQTSNVARRPGAYYIEGKGIVLARLREKAAIPSQRYMAGTNPIARLIIIFCTMSHLRGVQVEY